MFICFGSVGINNQKGEIEREMYFVPFEREIGSNLFLNDFGG
jgi:hypothetical protein